MSKNTLSILFFALIIVGGFAFYDDNELRSHNKTQNFSREIIKANKSARNWIFNNLRENGLFVYSYNIKTNEMPDKNNAIRQLMASIILAKESGVNYRVKKLQQKNLDFLFTYWYKQENKYDKQIGYIYYDNKSKLGANAMFLRVLIQSPFFEKYNSNAVSLANGILILQNKDGSFEPWYIEPDYNYDRDYLLTFYSGEAALSLIEFYEKTKEIQYLNAAIKAEEFYIHNYVEELELNYYPAYVPWHTIVLNKLYKITNEEKYADAIFVLNDKLLEIQDIENHIGRFYNPETPQYGNPHSSSDGVYVEGLAYAYEIAELLGDNRHKEIYKDAIVIGIENLIKLQYKKREFNNADLGKYLGAIRVRHNSEWIRIDTTQHAINAFDKVLEVFSKR